RCQGAGAGPGDQPRPRRGPRWPGPGGGRARRRRALRRRLAARGGLARQGRARGRGVAGMKARILVVDDEPQILRFLRATLTGHGYGVSTAADAEAALIELRGRLPDLVLLDLGLPDLDGLELCRRLREESERPEW